MRRTFLDIGKVTGANGLTGSLRVSPYDPESDLLFLVKTVWLLRGDGQNPQPQTLVKARRIRHGQVIQLAQVQTIEAAEALKGVVVAVEREAARAAKGMKADEYFFEELQGLAVKSDSGTLLGNVHGLFATGPGGPAVIAVRDGEKEMLLPYSSEVVKKVDLDAGEMVVHLIPGLLEVNES